MNSRINCVIVLTIAISLAVCVPAFVSASEKSRTISEVENMIGSGEDLKMLSRLNDAINKDPSLKNSAKSQIQKIFLSIIKRTKVEDPCDNRKILASAESIVKHYADDKSLSFSYERVLSWELLQILADAQIDVLKNTVGSDLSSFFKAVNETRQTRVKVVFAALSLLDEEADNLDGSARKHLWEYANRLLKGGPYFTGGGIESSDEARQILQKAYDKENDPEVRKTARVVLDNIDKLKK